MPKRKHGSQIDSPYTPFAGKVPTPSSGGPGSYNKHPNVGPAGVSGGVPLKFTDDSIKTQKGPIASSMDVVPAKLTTS